MIADMPVAMAFGLGLPAPARARDNVHATLADARSRRTPLRGGHATHGLRKNRFPPPRLAYAKAYPIASAVEIAHAIPGYRTNPESRRMLRSCMDYHEGIEHNNTVKSTADVAFAAIIVMA